MLNGKIALKCLWKKYSDHKGIKWVTNVYLYILWQDAENTLTWQLWNTTSLLNGKILSMFRNNWKRGQFMWTKPLTDANSGRMKNRDCRPFHRYESEYLCFLMESWSEVWKTNSCTWVLYMRSKIRAVIYLVMIYTPSAPKELAACRYLFPLVLTGDASWIYFGWI